TAVGGTLMIEDKKGLPGAMMSYTAYFKKGEGKRPITFIYNGGPGSATLWLQMGAFGPRRVIAGDAERGPAAPYKVVDNDSSPLDVSDLVFIDMPGTGFGRIGIDEKTVDPEKVEAIAKKNEELKKEFFGVDQDARAFEIFITKFLTRFDRWNSPRFLFGESYGTLRSAALVRRLQAEDGIDMNGVMLLSQILNYASSPDSARNELGEDLPFVTSLPTFAATAWYHKKLPNQPKDLEPFLADVRKFAIQEYQPALSAGDSLAPDAKKAMAAKLHTLIGLSADYIEKANLRVSGGMFRKELLDDQGLVTGRLDTRYTSPPTDPLSKEVDYDPQSAAIGSAYLSAFNEYARGPLGWGKEAEFNSHADVYRTWDTKHQPPGSSMPLPKTTNVIPDLAVTMRTNPKLKVMLCSGYFDLSTAFFAGEYELNHLGLPAELKKNIEIKHFMTGHMVYVNEDALKQLHDAFAGFVTANSNQKS
ncbi:MAG TPA: peptidase S10, partial [Magnetospirillaceae bacterium]|nr:peptidase S10 [Magnetospirillaceae bacterium]